MMSVHSTCPPSEPASISGAAPHCFVGGTRIATVRGAVAVEDLQPGDLVQTMDSGLKPIQWIGGRAVDGTGIFAPVRFRAGAIGNTRDLLVSPQHRILVRNRAAEPKFGDTEVLVAARHLVDGDKVVFSPKEEVEYFHILFDQHEVVFSEGAATESFFPGAQVLERDAELREELQALFPELFDGTVRGFVRTARRVADGLDAPLQRAA